MSTRVIVSVSQEKQKLAYVYSGMYLVCSSSFGCAHNSIYTSFKVTSCTPPEVNYHVGFACNSSLPSDSEQQSSTHTRINSCTLNHGAPWTVRRSIWKCSLALDPSRKLCPLSRENPCVCMCIWKCSNCRSHWTHTVKDLLSLTVTIILTQIWGVISMIRQNISSIASTGSHVLLHLTWVCVTVLTRTSLSWCCITSRSGQSVYFCIKNEIKHYRTFLPARSKAWTFFFWPLCAWKRCLCASFAGVCVGSKLHGYQHHHLVPSEVCWCTPAAASVSPWGCQSLSPSSVPPAPLQEVSGGTTCLGIRIKPKWVDFVQNVVLLTKEGEEEAAERRGFRSRKKSWEFISNSLACYNR